MRTSGSHAAATSSERKRARLRLSSPFDRSALKAPGFTRVETFGDNAPNRNNDVHWLKLFVDATSREVFAYQPQIVPGNRTAVPEP
jgi:hypothetical protein